MTTKCPHSGDPYLLDSNQKTCNCHALPSPEGRFAGQRIDPLRYKTYCNSKAYAFLECEIYIDWNEANSMLRPATVEDYKKHEETLQAIIQASRQRNPRRGPGRPTKEEAERRKQTFDALRRMIDKDNQQ